MQISQKIINFFILQDISDDWLLRLIGRWMSIIFSVGYGLTVFSSLFEESYANAIFVAICVAAMNCFMSYKDTPQVLAELFGNNDSLRILVRNKKLLTLGGAIFALDTGIGAAALSYESIPESLERLDSTSTGLNYTLTSIFSITTVTCFTSMLFRSITILLNNRNLKDDIKAFLNNTFDHNRDSNSNSNFVKLLFIIWVILFMLVGSFGLYFETYPGYPSTTEFVENKLHTSYHFADTFSLINALIIPLIAQYPFTLRTLFKTAVATKNQFKRIVSAGRANNPSSGNCRNQCKLIIQYSFDQLPNLLYTIARCVNAHGNGKLAEKYAADDFKWFAYMASFLLSYSFAENTKPDLSLGLFASSNNHSSNSGSISSNKSGEHMLLISTQNDRLQ